MPNCRILAEAGANAYEIDETFAWATAPMIAKPFSPGNAFPGRASGSFDKG
jgi:hypothetical protein